MNDDPVKRVVWPFPSKLPAPPTNGPVPRFNPNNHEDALL
jgi:hypothetical protein